MSDHADHSQKPEANDLLSKYPGPISWVVTVIVGVIFLGGLYVRATTLGEGDHGGGDHGATSGDHGEAKAGDHGADKAGDHGEAKAEDHGEAKAEEPAH